MIDKLIEKYQIRLMALEENESNQFDDDYYPYKLDIQTTKEIIEDLESIEKSKYKIALEVYHEFSNDCDPIKWTYDYQKWCKSKDEKNEK